jgi:hypothetical protein
VSSAASAVLSLARAASYREMVIPNAAAMTAMTAALVTAAHQAAPCGNLLGMWSTSFWWAGGLVAGGLPLLNDTYSEHHYM